MAISVWRGLTSERLDLRNPEAEVEVLALRSTDEAAVEAAVLAFLPATFRGLTLDSVPLQELGGGVWKGTATYRLKQGEPLAGHLPGVGPPGGAPGPPPATPAENEDLSEVFSFKTGGGTEHVRQSLKTRHASKRGGGVAPNFKQAVGIDEHGHPAGCDKIFGRLEWSLAITAVGGISLAYLKRLARLVGTTNKDFFYHREPGELLLLGVSGQRKGPAGVSLTFDFAESPNLLATNPDDLERLTIVPETDANGDPTPGGGLILPAKRGHDYVWALYEKQLDGGKVGGMPVAAYVEKIYPEANWTNPQTGLGIGGA